jgi:hypothetical protein
MPAKKAKSRKKATSKKSAHRQSTSIPKVQAESPKPAQTDSQKDPCPISPTQPSNEAQPPKRVVREGGTAEPQDQLSPAIPDEQASHARQNTGQLLASTDENLKKAAGRNLDANQQAMLAQIRKFMEQANEAVAAGDVQRGHNLAMKAHMLSDDLVRH